MDLKINLFNDWIQLLKHDLTSRGYQINPNDDDSTIGIKYFNYCKRIIESKTRTILESDVFNCPSDLLSGLAQIKDKITQGIDLSPHLSTRLTDLNYNDDLLNDWGIYHLHLGTSLDPIGFVSRTGPLLFARFDNEKAYFINVMPHGSWTKQEMIRVVHNNWPQSIDQFRIRDVVGLTHVPTDDEVKLFRKANVNTMIQIQPGIVYSQPGGGYASSGVSARAVLASNRYHKTMIQIEKYIKTNIDKILVDNGHSDLLGEAELEFHLQIENGNIYVVETNNRVALNYGEL